MLESMRCVGEPTMGHRGCNLLGDWLDRYACSSYVRPSLRHDSDLSHPAIVLVGVFTTFSVMFVGFYYHVPPSVEILVKHHDIVNAFSFSWSAATNVWATAMIAYKAWYVSDNIIYSVRSPEAPC